MNISSILYLILGFVSFPVAVWVGAGIIQWRDERKYHQNNRRALQEYALLCAARDYINILLDEKASEARVDHARTAMTNIVYSLPDEYDTKMPFTPPRIP